MAALAVTLALAGCARPTPEQQFIDDAFAALGGRSRIEAAKSLAIEGTGVNFNLGQADAVDYFFVILAGMSLSP